MSIEKVWIFVYFHNICTHISIKVVAIQQRIGSYESNYSETEQNLRKFEIELCESAEKSATFHWTIITLMNCIFFSLFDLVCRLDLEEVSTIRWLFVWACNCKRWTDAFSENLVHFYTILDVMWFERKSNGKLPKALRIHSKISTLNAHALFHSVTLEYGLFVYVLVIWSKLSTNQSVNDLHGA